MTRRVMTVMIMVLFTINIDEADDIEREMGTQQMDEVYGHSRHLGMR